MLVNMGSLRTGLQRAGFVAGFLAAWAEGSWAAEGAGKPAGRSLDRFEMFDRDHDGRVTASELGQPVLFQLLDLNGDGVILRAEAVEALENVQSRKRWARLDASPSVRAQEAAVSLTETLRVIPATTAGIGKRLLDWDVRTLNGQRRRLAPGPGRRGLVVAVTSSSCPLSRKYAPVLARMEAEYQPRGFDFVFLAPVTTDSPESVAALAKAQGWLGEMVLDPQHETAGVLGVRSTTEVLVYDAARTLIYRGAIDDQYGLGYSRATAQTRPLAQALEAVLAGHFPEVTATTAPGCVVEAPTPGPGAIPPKAPVTYHHQIARLIQRHCVECHREGGLAPFPLQRYEDVVAHAGTIRRQVDRGVMPPWFAASTHDQVWSNDRSLAAGDRAELLAWLDGDRPAGDPAEAPLPLKFPAEWSIGKPDLVLQIPQPIAIPAEGVMEYQQRVVSTELTEDRWVSAVEIQPTAPAVVHHVLVFVRPPKAAGKRRGDDGVDEGSGFFAAYVPGNSYEALPEGFAKRLPAGSRLRFQIHYTPNGQATNDQVRMGLKFRTSPPRHSVHVIGLANPLLKIPAGASRHAEQAGSSVPHEARILAFLPHMHLRGTAFRYEVQEPGGAFRTLLDIPRYDFNWQLTYRCAEPIRVPAGSRLRATGWFNNSAANPANPDPTREVPWGLQTYDEMLLGYVEYYFPEEVP